MQRYTLAELLILHASRRPERVRRMARTRAARRRMIVSVILRSIRA